MADNNTKSFGSENHGHIKFKPVKDSGTTEPGKKLGTEVDAQETPPKFRAVKPDGGSIERPGSASPHDTQNPPRFKAAASIDGTQSTGRSGTNDEKPLFRAVNPGSGSGFSSASSNTYRSEEWKDELTAFLTIVRCIAYSKSLDLTEAMGGGSKVSPTQDSLPSKATAGPNISPKVDVLPYCFVYFLAFWVPTGSIPDTSAWASFTSSQAEFSSLAGSSTCSISSVASFGIARSG